MRSLLHSSLGILLLVLATSPAAAALSPDGLALLAFKSAVTDDPTSALAAWSANDTDPCRWPGVACVNTSSSEARVAGVAVAGKNLSGSLPPELGSLALLRRLNLHGNRLSGAVPPALSNATSLRSVFLYDNNLTGGFPASLCDLPRLQNLDLSRNSLAGPLPPALGRCRQLQRLLLSNNGFSGRMPAAALPLMESLQLLDLSSNSLTGAIPPELGRLPALAGTLNISRNHLSGAVPPELGHLPATVTLDLRFNNLSGEIPQSGSLASQGPTAFLNNPGLCGFPLQVPCRAAPPSASTTPPPTTTGSSGSAGGPSQPMKTSLIVLISVADAAGVALIGVIVVYIYWKLRDRRRDGDDDEEEEGRGLFACPCMHASTCGDSSEGSDAGGGEKKCGGGGGGGGGGGAGGEDGELVAIDKGFRMELDELLRSSAYVLGKGGKGIVYKVVVGNGTTPVAVRRLGGGTAAPERYKEFAAEAGAIGRVRHANVVRLRAYYWSADEKLVVTDFINNGNLATALRAQQQHLDDDDDDATTMLRLALALAYRRPSAALRVTSDEDQEAKASYQVALAPVLRDSEEEERRRADEEAAYQQQLAEAIALSAADDCVVPPPLKPEPTEPREVYQWNDVVSEFVSVPPILLGPTPQQEQAYLEHWRTEHVRAERAEGFRLMELEKEAEEERRELEEEECARAAALPRPPAQPARFGTDD
ncbi:putative inactive leucine-rich repeat receptor-like protein kinase [Hordeum vulgare]|nr:putative inactive leucine-rich repeat receptor-like protein kinase [Hordeum vulgare]